MDSMFMGYPRIYVCFAKETWGQIGVHNLSMFTEHTTWILTNLLGLRNISTEAVKLKTFVTRGLFHGFIIDSGYQFIRLKLSLNKEKIIELNKWSLAELKNNIATRDIELNNCSFSLEQIFIDHHVILPHVRSGQTDSTFN